MQSAIMNSTNTWWLSVATSATAGGLIIGLAFKKLGVSHLCRRILQRIFRCRNLEKNENICEVHHSATSGEGDVGNIAGNALVIAEFPREGTPRSETPHEGTPRSGTPREGTPRSGTPREGTPRSGTPREGTPRSGTPREGTPRSGTSRSGTPLEEIREEIALEEIPLEEISFLEDMPCEDMDEFCDEPRSLAIYDHASFSRYNNALSEILYVDYCYQSREEIFPAQRKVAFKELCNKFENIIYIMIFIVLFFHLIAEKEEEDEPIQLTRWESIMASIRAFGRAILQKFGYYTEKLLY